MTINAQTGISDVQLGDGTNLVFPFEFKIGGSDEIEVYVDGVLLAASEYSVDLSADWTGDITFDEAPADGAEIVLVANPDFVQSSVHQRQGPFYPDVVEDDLDRAALRDIWLKRETDRAFKLDLLNSTAQAGLFPVVMPDGTAGFSSGTGADAGLRADAAASGGSALVGHIATGADTVARTAQAKLREIVTPADFTNNLEGALAAVVRAGDLSFNGAVTIPNGEVRPNAAIPLPAQFAKIAGNVGGTYWPANATNVFEGSATTHVLSQFRGFRTYGGVNVFNIAGSGEVAQNEYDRLQLSQFTGSGFNFAAGDVTSCTFSRMAIGSTVGAYGIKSDGGINNDNTVHDIDFDGLSDSAIKFAGTTNGLYISSVRVENGGQNGKSVYDLTDAIGVRIGTGWYEAHHETLLKLTGACDAGVTIDGIIDVGAYVTPGVFKASLFDVGTNLVSFGHNYFSNLTLAPVNVFLHGINTNLYMAASNVWVEKHQRGGKVHTKNRDRTVVAGTFDLFTFARASATPNTSGNIQALSGLLHLTFAGYETPGTVERRFTKAYPFLVTAMGLGPSVTVTVGSEIAAFAVGTAGAITLVPTAKSGATQTSGTLELVTANIDTVEQSLISVTLEFNNNTNLASNAFTVTPA